MQYPAALEIVRKLVKPHRDEARRKAYRERWWRLEEPIVGMREALKRCARYIASPAQAKRFYMVDDDYSMGVLTSAVHTRWATHQSTTLETRPRYTTASFATFAWPEATPSQRRVIGDLARRIVKRRQQSCLDGKIGLTTLYNEVDDGAYKDLRELHAALDEAVAAAYGWPDSAAHDAAESNRRLLELNRDIIAGKVAYKPFD